MEERPVSAICHQDGDEDGGEEGWMSGGAKMMEREEGSNG